MKLTLESLKYLFIRQKGERPDGIASTSKNGLKVNICGGIFFKSPTPFAVRY
jgi:hypothetical protein